VVWRGYCGDRAIDGADADEAVAGEGVDWVVSGFESGAFPDVGKDGECGCAEAVCGIGYCGKVCNVGSAVGWSLNCWLG
jgi:hypothetical protein